MAAEAASWVVVAVEPFAAVTLLAGETSIVVLVAGTFGVSLEACSGLLSGLAVAVPWSYSEDIGAAAGEPWAAGIEIAAVVVVDTAASLAGNYSAAVLGPVHRRDLAEPVEVSALDIPVAVELSYTEVGEQVN